MIGSRTVAGAGPLAASASLPPAIGGRWAAVRPAFERSVPRNSAGDAAPPPRARVEPRNNAGAECRPPHWPRRRRAWEQRRGPGVSRGGVGMKIGASGGRSTCPSVHRHRVYSHHDHHRAAGRFLTHRLAQDERRQDESRQAVQADETRKRPRQPQQRDGEDVEWLAGSGSIGTRFRSAARSRSSPCAADRPDRPERTAPPSRTAPQKTCARPQATGNRRGRICWRSACPRPPNRERWPGQRERPRYRALIRWGTSVAGGRIAPSYSLAPAALPVPLR